jgi:ribose transport system permease protein
MTTPAARDGQQSAAAATPPRTRRSIVLPRAAAFWCGVAVVLLAVVLAITTDTFATRENLFNVTRNVAFIGLMALGQVVVIVTGGIDLSAGSVLGLAGIVTALVLEAGHSLALGAAAGVGTALLCGLANGALIAYLRLSPFVVTLGMLSIGRSLALVVSRNRMIHELGPAEDRLVALGGGSTLGIANPVWILVALAALLAIALRGTAWGRHLYAVGGNEAAARANGIRVERVKLGAYVLSALAAGVAAVLTVGWLGAVTNALGQGYELRVIAASVMGGANLAGGEGGAFGGVLGAMLLEVIRNGLLLAGVDPWWQGTFVGSFIILAVVIERVRGRRQ